MRILHENRYNFDICMFDFIKVKHVESSNTNINILLGVGQRTRRGLQKATKAYQDTIC